MQAVDQQVIGQTRDWLHSGQSCWLATVVATYGSSPRPMGSLLTCNRHGQLTGSLSGGCVEDDLLAKLTAGQLAARMAEHPRHIVRPLSAGRPGNPIGFPARLFDALTHIHGETGARHIVADCDCVLQVAVDDPGIHQDIDRPSDLARRSGRR